MPTTIQISDNVKSILDKMKMVERETYNDIIERMIEDDLELNEQTKKEIEEAKKRIKAGKFITQQEVEKRLRIRCSK
jgi:predicted transcriptional regulator